MIVLLLLLYKIFPSFYSSPFPKIKKNIISGIKESKFITYTGDRAERLLLKLFGFNPIQATDRLFLLRMLKTLYKSASSFKCYRSNNNMDLEWNSYVSPNVSNIIKNNWNVIEHFSNSADKTIHMYLE